jgi:Peptidase C10 family.
MKLKISVFFTLLAILWGPVSAKPVDETTARAVASHFYAMQYNHAPESPAPALAYVAPSIHGKNGYSPSFYVFNFDSEGFVIVAGDDRVQPILAFSDEGAFVAENMPAHIRFFLDGYTEEIQYMVNHRQHSDKTILHQWETLISSTPLAPKDGDVVVGPLLGNNKWNQTKYYNDLCPADASGNAAYGGHAAAGCGALVMGQVMRYWQFPVTGTGSHSYNSSYGTLSANFGATTYRYENMPNQLTTTYHPDSCVEAVATLLYHCGVAVNMNYGPSASVANSNRIVTALSTYFRYPATVQYLERGNLSSAVWLNYLKGELDEGAPFMYGGSGNYGGHVWTCDGYRDDNYFHFNWGWGGQQNGYYALTNCSSYGFNSNHAIIIGIRGPELPSTIEEHRMGNIQVFPNPSTGSVYVCTEQQPVSDMQVFDMSGRMLFHKSVGKKEFSFDLSGYKAGIYILRLVTSEGVVTSKIIKK